MSEWAISLGCTLPLDHSILAEKKKLQSEQVQRKFFDMDFLESKIRTYSVSPNFSKL